MEKRVTHVHLALLDLGQMGVAGSDDQRKTAHRETLRFAQLCDSFPELGLSVKWFHEVQVMGYNG